MNTDPKVKAAFCHCGKPFLVSVLPHAEINKDSVKDFRKAAKEGYRIDYISLEEARTAGLCFENCKAA